MYDNNRIKVTNTAIIVDNYTMGESEELEKPFRIFDPVRHKIETKGLYYDEDNKRLYLPAGIDLWFVRRALKEKYYTRINNTPYKNMESNVGMKYKPRDKEQQEALKFMCAVNEYEDNLYRPQLSVNLNPGKGKTFCSIATMCFFKIKSMVITSSNSLLSQWEDNIVEYTNIKRNEILRINGSDFCNMILNGSSQKAKNAKIYLCSHGTLRSFGDRYGWDKVSQLFESLGIGLKFYDEAHTSFDNMLMIDFFTNVYKTYYLTANFGRSEAVEDRIFKKSFSSVVQYEYKKDDARKHIIYVPVLYRSNPSYMDIASTMNAYGFSVLGFANYSLITDINQTLLHKFYTVFDVASRLEGKILVTVPKIELVEKMKEWIQKEYPYLEKTISTIHSKNTKEENLEATNADIICSTIKSCGTGVDIKGLRSIINMEPFSSQIVANQLAGRLREYAPDKDTFFFDLVDIDFSTCESQYKKRMRALKKKCKEIYFMNMYV